MGGKLISVDLSLSVLLYKTNFMSKVKFNDFFYQDQKYFKKILSTKSPHFPHRGKVGQLVRGRECFVGLYY